MSYQETHLTSNDPLWYKDAIIYQLHLRSFYDSDANGIGDFQGLTEKLDYLEDLGVTAIWLLPFYPSPLKDDGYDISNYIGIHPFYGTMEDFNRFLRKAHSKEIRVITELVINHTSDLHPWFQKARRSPKGSSLRDFYVWSDSPEKYKGARIIFKDFETSNWAFDRLAGSYYWHRFYSHQPDLNYENPQVKKAVFKILDFWLDKGVDGLRLDAIPYLYEQEGTSCENLPQTHTFLKELRAHVDRHYQNRVLLAEANQWPEQVVHYFGQDDECHMALHFPIMPRLFMAIRMENHFPIIDILNQTPAIPPNSQWAMFLRNHDELTLEMVTDRDRDYMYQVYARDRAMRINLGIRRRLAPLLGNDRRQIELMKCLLFSMPGTPILYYGDEIGMGDNVYLGDRNGIRTPMQWSADQNAGFSRANPQQLFLPITLDPEYHYEAINVKTQQNNQNSLLWWMKHLVNLRKRFKAFGRGSIKFLNVKNPKILAFLREYDSERILVIANLAGSVQHTELELSAYSGMVPVELFGQTRLPPIEGKPYLFVLGPYGFYWLELQEQSAAIQINQTRRAIPSLRIEDSWENFLAEKNRRRLERILTEYVKTCSWFAERNQPVDTLKIVDHFRISADSAMMYILLLEIEYESGLLEKFILPIGYASSEKIEKFRNESEQAVIAMITLSKERQGAIYDAIYNDEFFSAIFKFVARKRNLKGIIGKLTSSAGKPIKAGEIFKLSVKYREEYRVIVNFNDTFLLKLFRRLEPGLSPDLELSRYLTEKKRFTNTMQLRGSLEYNVFNEEPATIGIIYDYVPNQGSAWNYTLNYLTQNYESGGMRIAQNQKIPESPNSFYSVLNEQPPEFIREFFNIYLQQAQLLGQRAAQLHTALGMDTEEPAFKPEPFTDFYKYSHYQTLYGLLRDTFRLLENRIPQLPEDIRNNVQSVLSAEKDIAGRFKALRDRTITAMRIRIHGDFGLGKVLYTGKDFIIINFEGQFGQSLSERRNKVCPLRDVATMLRSIHYASFVSTFNIPQGGFPLAVEDIEPLRNLWYVWTSSAFVGSYLKHIRNMPFMPKDDEEIKVLLDGYILERAIFELQCELIKRSEWVRVPVEGIIQIIRSAK